LIFSRARNKRGIGVRLKLMLKQSEAGERRAKQPCGRREFEMRKLGEEKGKY
jgi:hypothetical protein